MRRVIWITIAAAVAALATTNVSLASPGSSSNATQTISLVSRATTINNFVDTGPSGPSPGDLYVFSDRLFLASTPDDQVGISDGRCVLIDPAALRFDCSSTVKLPEGDIMVAGTLTLVEGTTNIGAIVGGTEAYRKARGDGRLTLGPLEGPHDVTLDLILNP